MTDLDALLRALSWDTTDAGGAVTQQVIDAAQEHGVAMLLFDLQRSAARPVLSPHIAQTLLELARQQTVIELARLIGIRRVLGSLDQAGIPVLLLKGSALAYWLYDNPAQRSRCDLDILVADKATAKHATDALQRSGYALSIEALEASAEFEVALERTLPGGILHRVDLHWQVVNHARLAEGLTFADLDAHAISIPSLQCDARGLGMVHALVHALLHRITNMPSGAHDRLIWLYDIHLLAQRFTSEDWSEFLRQCVSLACATPCLDGLRATRAVFGTPIPQAVEHLLQAQSNTETWALGLGLGLGVDQGAMDRAHLAALSWPQKLGWLRRKLLPSRKFMRYRYGEAGGAGLLRAYMRRWWTGFRSALGWWR